CPSGLTTVIVRAPNGAPTVFRSSVTEVGLVTEAPLTVTPSGTEAASRPAYPAPGSKKPDPAVEMPVTATETQPAPDPTEPSVALAGVGGGGAISSTTRTPHESAALQYSWIVHIVMSSSGSRLVNE